MRRSVAVVVAALAVAGVLALAGCGGGGTPAASTGGTGTTTAPKKAAGAADTSAAGLSAQPITDPRDFPQVDQLTAPQSVLDALAAKRAFVIVFWDSRQLVTASQREVIGGLENKFRGLIDFMTFDLAAVDKSTPGSAAYKNAALATGLAQKLNVGYEPAIVVTDKSGQITWQSTGFLDSGTLQREILRATQ